MGVEEYAVIVRSHNGKGKRQFAYFVDPKKKANVESVLRDFRLDSQIDDERRWRLCTLTGNEIRWLADYADRVLVLEPIEKSAEAHLPKLGVPSTKMVTRQAIQSDSESISKPPAILRTKSTELRDHNSESLSMSSGSSTTLKLPSLSTSSSGGSTLTSGSGPKRNDRLGRLNGALPKTDSLNGYAHRNKDKKNDQGKRERNR